MFLHVEEAKYIGGYKVEVAFNDGRKGIADLSDAIRGPIFEQLKDTSAFVQLTVDKELDTITWPNGADLAPEYIYFKAFKDNLEWKENFKKGGQFDAHTVPLGRR